MAMIPKRSGRKPVRQSEMDLLTRAQMKQLGRWLEGKDEGSELPKQANTEERKRKNRARADTTRRVGKWKRMHKKAYNAYMRAYLRLYRKRMRLAAMPDNYSVCA